MSDTPTAQDPATRTSYALKLADDSYGWYRRAAIRARRAHHTSETLVLLTSAAIPLSAVLVPDDATVPALLGAAVVVLTGLRSRFLWRENFLRFSRAREAIEAERRLFRTGSKPYDDPASREGVLAAAVTRVEQEEMNVWVEIASATSSGREAVSET